MPKVEPSEHQQFLAVYETVIDYKYYFAKKPSRYRTSTDRIGDWKFLGSGISRHAFNIGKGRVLKVASTATCTDYNRKEVERWESAPPELKQFLCPIIAYDSEYRWVVMRRAYKVGNVPHEAKTKIWNAIVGIVRDSHDFNMGKVGRNYVMIDYAM